MNIVVNGIQYSEETARSISKAYRRAMTADYLTDSYGISSNQALLVAEEVHDYMEKLDFAMSENDAIFTVIKKSFPSLIKYVGGLGDESNEYI